MPSLSFTAVVLGSLLFLKPSPLPSNPASHSVLSRWGLSCVHSSDFSTHFVFSLLHSVFRTPVQGPSDDTAVSSSKSTNHPQFSLLHTPNPLILHLPHHPEVILSHEGTVSLPRFFSSSLLCGILLSCPKGMLRTSPVPPPQALGSPCHTS